MSRGRPSRVGLLEHPVVRGMHPSSGKTVSIVASSTLDEVSRGLRTDSVRIVGIGEGHMALHVERCQSPASLLRVGQHFEAGSRRGRELLPASEIGCVRAPRGWRLVSLRHAASELPASELTTRDGAVGTEDSKQELFPNAWLGITQERLILAARRAS